MSYKVLVKVHSDEKSIQKKNIEFYIDSHLKPHLHVNKVWENLDRANLNPPIEAIDFFRFALSVYACDLRLSRLSTYDNWTREIELHFPVNDLEKWEKTKNIIEEMIGFLTGDIWRFKFYKTNFKRPRKNVNYRKKIPKINTSTVSLFSGGLDSFIGASNLLHSGENVYLVGHYDKTSTNHAKPAQDRCYEFLQSKYSNNFELLKYYVNVPKSISTDIENTTRSRSIIFMALGVLTASSLSENSKLIVPENGFIGLNIPLGHSRIGSFTTRTTHPYTLEMLNKVLKSLDLSVGITNPYFYQTKGQMIQKMSDKTGAASGLSNTISCAHPAQLRFDKTKPGGVGQCGYCVPCIIRRSAMYKNGLDNKGEYSYDLRDSHELSLMTANKKEDMQAFYNAIERFPTINKSIVLKSGPINSDLYSIDDFYSMYSNGINEVNDFLL